MQRAAEGDVEHLMAAADRQHRLVLGDGRAGQGEVERVVLVAHVDQPGMQLVDAVAVRRDVGSAGQAQGVDASHHVVGRRLDVVGVEQRWYGERGAAGPDDRLLVRASEGRRRDAPRVGGVGEPRRQGDQGAHRPQRTVGAPNSDPSGRRHPSVPWPLSDTRHSSDTKTRERRH